MKHVYSFEMPEDKERTYRRAIHLECLTLLYLALASALLFSVLGGSQAMKAEWLEKSLSATPPIAFLLAARLRRRAPNEDYPWGYHRVVSIAYLTAALALLVLGAYLLLDSTATLLRGERPSLGLFALFGIEVWIGFAMLVALALIIPPPILLARRKLPIAADLHDKVLYADADMNKADWMTTAAAIVGVLGIGLGLWWGDAAAASAIALSILHDGWGNLRSALHDLMDGRPWRYDSKTVHPLVDELQRRLEEMDWVQNAEIRLREQGHVFAGEAIVVPRDDEDLLLRCSEARKALLQCSWKLHDLVVVPVPAPEGPVERERTAAETG
jgi:cation diffusion facilitator family transporter